MNLLGLLGLPLGLAFVSRGLGSPGGAAPPAVVYIEAPRLDTYPLEDAVLDTAPLEDVVLTTTP